MHKRTRKPKVSPVKVNTELLARGILQPSDSDEDVTVVTPLEDLTTEDREDLKDFATFVLNMRSQPKPPHKRRCGSRS